MREFIDPYSNEDTELKLLNSKPVSFLVVGKRRTGKSLCARHLSSEWGAKARFLIGSFILQLEDGKMKGY